MEARLAVLENRVSSIESEVQEHRVMFREVSNTMTELHNTMSDLRETAAATRQEMHGLRDTVRNTAEFAALKDEAMTRDIQTLSNRQWAAAGGILLAALAAILAYIFK